MTRSRLRTLLLQIMLPAVLGAALVGLLMQHSFRSDLDDARDAAKDATELARGMQEVALATAEQAYQYKLAADKAEAEAAALRLRAAGRVAVFQHEAAAAPDTCAPIIEAAASAIATLDSTATVERTRGDSLSAAYEAQKRATAALNTAVDVLVPATETLVTASKPSFLSKLLPDVHLGVGGGVGLDMLNRGKPYVYVGPQIELSWDIL